MGRNDPDSVKGKQLVTPTITKNIVKVGMKMSEIDDTNPQTTKTD